MSYYYLKKASAAQKVVEEMKSNGFVQPQGIGPRSRSIGSAPKPLTFRPGSALSAPTAPKAPKQPKSPRPPKAPKELMTSVKLEQKAAGYLLAAANARSRE